MEMLGKGLIWELLWGLVSGGLGGIPPCPSTESQT